MAQRNTEEFLKKLGESVAHHRKEHGLSQTELATMIDKERQNLNKMEKGKANTTILYLLEVADALEIPLSTLLNFKY